MLAPERAAWGAGLALCLACGAHAPATPSSSPSPSTSAGPAAERPPTRAAPIVSDPRLLAAGSTFGDLVQRLHQLDQHPSPSEAGCLLRLGAKDSARLEAEAAVAVRPPPPAPVDLDPLLQSNTGPVRVLSRWGQHGGTVHSLALVGLTAAVPTAQAVAVILTDEGVYVRGTEGESPVQPVPLEQLADALAQRAPAAGSWTAFVTAEGAVTVHQLGAVLAALPYPNCEVSLAVPLAPGTKLPPSELPQQPAPARCPQGLPETDADEGDLAVPAIQAALGPLTAGAAQCLASTKGPAASGARMRLALRIGPDGRVAHTCLPQDEPRDDALGTCVLGHARRLQFQAPAGGIVDVELPLRLTPDPSLRQRPLCD